MLRAIQRHNMLRTDTLLSYIVSVNRIYNSLEKCHPNRTYSDAEKVHRLTDGLSGGLKKTVALLGIYIIIDSETAAVRSGYTYNLRQ